ncbi:unnamed protein product [Cladocopium goreaui]|uniref:Uncharacterized protein n=1 Tax=Cladocopium goreaui TaxID=2562237 RepID=A0A9P1G844_9DINO|nr:unnamed protein product [Cladocopium goreaui]
MAVAPGDFLSTFEAQVAEHWDATRATHASLAEHIVKKDLPGLMTYDKEDPHGILALAPAQLEPCADVVSGFGEAAMACAAEFEFFLPAAEEDLGALLESCSENTYEAMADDLRVAYAQEELAVERTKSAIEGLDGLSLTGALLQKMEQTKVDQMDDEEKAEQFEKMQSQLHLEHVEQTKGAVSALLSKSHLPPLHDQVEARQLLLDALKRKADAVSSKKDVADKLFAGLEQQHADVLDKIQKCSRIRRLTIRAEENKRKTLEEAEKARQVAWKEYQDAYLRNEAATILEAELKLADESLKEELEAAGAALAQTRTQCHQCFLEAATSTEAVNASIQAAHATLLAYSRPTVEAAWKTAAFASELGKCLVAAKRTEHDHLLEEKQKCQKLAQKQKQPKVKALTLEKVERLGVQISEISAELADVQALSLRAEDQFNSFKVLKSGLNEDAITRAAQDAASTRYGNSQLYVSDDDSEGSTEASGPTMAIQQHLPNPLDKLRIDMEEKFKIEKQQLMAEFQLEKQQLLLAMREEVRAEMRREDTDASSLNSFEPIEETCD